MGKGRDKGDCPGPTRGSKYKKHARQVSDLSTKSLPFPSETGKTGQDIRPTVGCSGESLCQVHCQLWSSS